LIQTLSLRYTAEIKRNIKPYSNSRQSAMSVITALELIAGAKNKKKQIEVSKTIKAYLFLDVTPAIGARAFTLVKKYGLMHTIGIADALIAATAIENKLQLYTDNVSDYEFIKELKLFKP